MYPSSEFALHQPVMYKGRLCRVNSIQFNAPYCSSAVYVYSLMPDGERCLSRCIHYVTAAVLEAFPADNEVLQAVAEHNRLALVKG